MNTIPADQREANCGWTAEGKTAFLNKPAWSRARDYYVLLTSMDLHLVAPGEEPPAADQLAGDWVRPEDTRSFMEVVESHRSARNAQRRQHARQESPPPPPDSPASSADRTTQTPTTVEPTTSCAGPSSPAPQATTPNDQVGHQDEAPRTWSLNESGVQVTAADKRRLVEYSDSD